MKILIATDAYHPQVNGVVRTLDHLAKEASALGANIEFLAPDAFWSLPLPSYPEIRLAIPRPGVVERRFDAVRPDAVHIATEGPLGYAMRALCLRRGLSFTTSLHTRFPDYLTGRLPVPEHWLSQVTWVWLRGFHSAGATVMAATPSFAAELIARGFHNVKLWPRGVDSLRFRPRLSADRGWRRPVFLTVGRLAVEKNMEAFLSLDLPGTKVVIGDGPARSELQRRYPEAVFLGERHGGALAELYTAADVFVFPSRTDTFGLVLLEALASGVPVAGFPVAATRDVIAQANASSPVGILDEDLRKACLGALLLSREACREHALTKSWRASARSFLDHVEHAAGTATIAA